MERAALRHMPLLATRGSLRGVGALARRPALAPLRDANRALEDAEGLFAKRDIPAGACLGLVPTSELFCARNVYANSPSPFARAVRDAMAGYEALAQTMPRAFHDMELALLLWFQRRAHALGFENGWTTWAAELPHCHPGNASFQEPEATKAALRESGASELGAASEQHWQLLQVFGEGLREDLQELLAIVEAAPAPDGGALWSRGDEARNGMTFRELLRDEYSLVLARAVAAGPTLADCPPVQDGTLASALVPGLDAVNIDLVSPNTTLVLSPPADTPAREEELRSWAPFASQKVLTEWSVGLYAVRDVAGGEEVTRPTFESRSDLLLRHGLLAPADWAPASDARSGMLEGLRLRPNLDGAVL